MFLLGIMLACVNFICAHYKRNPWWLFAIDYIFIFLVITGYFKGVDILNYRYNYEMAATGYETIFSSDFGYSVVEKFFSQNGYDFFFFKKVLTSVGLVLMFNGIIKLSNNPSFVLGYYLCYQLVIDTIQFRNFLGFCILMTAFTFLMKDDKKSKIIYIILIILATSFHIVMIFYLLFLVKDRKYLLKIAGILSISSGLIIIFNNYKIPFVNVFLGYLKKINASDAYVVGNKGNSISFILPIFTLVLYLLIFNYCKNRKGCNEILENIFGMDCTLLISIPLCILSFQWYRIIRNANILNHCGISNIKTTFRDKRLNEWIVLFFILLTAFWIYTEFFRFIGWDNVMTVFENNIYIVKDYY